MPDKLIIVSTERMHWRVRWETRRLYARRVTYPDCAGYTKAGILQYSPLDAGPLRVAVTSANTVAGRAFQNYIALMYMHGPMNEEQFLAFALNAPSPFRMVADLLSEGTLQLLRHYAQSMGQPVQTQFTDHGLFKQVSRDHYRPLVGLYSNDTLAQLSEGQSSISSLFWLVKAKRSLYQGDLELLDHKFQSCTWEGPEIKNEVEYFMSLSLPVVGADVVDIIRPACVYLWGKLPVRLEDIIWWVSRNCLVTISQIARPQSLAERRRRKEGRRFRRHALRRELRRRNDTAPADIVRPLHLYGLKVVEKALGPLRGYARISDAAPGNAGRIKGRDLMDATMDAWGIPHRSRRHWKQMLEDAANHNNAEQGAVGGPNVVPVDTNILSFRLVRNGPSAFRFE